MIPDADYFMGQAFRPRYNPGVCTGTVVPPTSVSPGFWVGLAVAQMDDPPGWMPGDEFEEIRKASH
jgi:hypothetical protein